MLATYLETLYFIIPIVLLGWIYSVIKHNVNLVDSLWSLMFLGAAVIYLCSTPEITTTQIIMITLVALWALRLSLHLCVRNWNKDEDHRYRTIRGNNEPFVFKSLYIVFGLQGFLAWLISIPLLFSVTRSAEFMWLDYIALALWTIGFLFESIADYQLLKFRKNPENKGRVLNTGLWRYTRHPNYFGEFCIWWAFYLFAFTAGGWWTIYSPLIMTFLLLRISGVVMMERNMTTRRPEYQQYIDNTSTFIPCWPGAKNSQETSQ